MNPKTILHISYDLRKEANRLPRAVRNLIRGTESRFRAVIVSLHRVSVPFRSRIEKVSENELEIDHFGLPFGILMRLNLNRVRRMVLAAGAQGLLDLGSVDVVHAHKLTYEGIAGLAIARALGRPLLVSLRATDAFVLRYRWDLRPVAKRILDRCAVIFYIAPYVRNEIRRCLGRRFYEAHVAERLVFLPNSVPRSTQRPGAARVQKGCMLTVLRMDTIKTVRRKNVRRLMRALAGMKESDVRLEIVGDGPCRPVVEGWARRFGVERQVAFLGFVDNDHLGTHYARAQAFLLPSFNETFGLVYAEALQEGTPILYSASTGFDGMFENVGVSVNPRSVRSIASGIRELLDHSQGYRDNIRRLMDARAFAVLTPEHSRKTYLESVLEKIP